MKEIISTIFEFFSSLFKIIFMLFSIVLHTAVMAVPFVILYLLWTNFGPGG